MPQPSSDGLSQFIGGLAHSAEHYPVGTKARRKSPGHFAGGDNVRTGAEIAQDTENSQIAVGLYRKTDPVGNGRKRLVQTPETMSNRLRVIHEGRSSNPVG